MHASAAEIPDFIAGCDGFHGVCRHSIPPGALTTYEHAYPFAWLGILAAVAPSTEELIYAVHERGFALHSMRSPTVSRLYLQVGPAESLDAWPDERIWAELRTRFSLEGGRSHDGPILSRADRERSFVLQPMQYGLADPAGDAAHIVPPSSEGAQPGGADITARRRYRVVTRTAVGSWTAIGPARDGAGSSGAKSSGVHDIPPPVPVRGRLRPGTARSPADPRDVEDRGDGLPSTRRPRAPGSVDLRTAFLPKAAVSSGSAMGQRDRRCADADDVRIARLGPRAAA